MRKIAFARILVIIGALASGSLVAICNRAQNVTQRQTIAIDPALLTLGAGTLPTVQVNEPF
jgi:hypothetical protein